MSKIVWLITGVLLIKTGALPAQFRIDTIIKLTNPRLSYPTWMDHGSKILFESDFEGNWEIYTMNPDGSGIVRLTHNTCLDRMPNGSPNGDQIVFISDRDGDYEVYRMANDGNLQTQVTNDLTHEIHPYWSPDGNEIIFDALVPGTRTYDIRTIHADGTGMKIILQDDDLNSYAQISPDGSKIVFDKWQDNHDFNGEIYVMDRQGGQLNRLTRNDSIYDGYPTWFTDGSTILFSSQKEGKFKLHCIGSDGTGLHQLTFGDGDDQRANVSPDGTQLVFNRNLAGDINIYTQQILPGEKGGYFLPVESLKQLSHPEFAYPCWSPDGTQIAYQGKMGDQWDIFIMNADGSGVNNLTNNPSDDMQPAWSPDGSSIVFVSNRDGDEEIFQMNATGKALRQLTNNQIRDIHPQWSPDGLRIVFNRNQEKDRLMVLTHEIESGEEKVLLNEQQSNSYASFAPDGLSLLFVKWLGEKEENGEIFLLDLATGTQQRLTHHPEFDGYPAWFPDGNHFIYSSRKEGVFKLFIGDRSTGESYELSDGRDSEVSASVSPDGLSILTNKYTEGRLNIYQLKLNLNGQ